MGNSGLLQYIRSLNPTAEQQKELIFDRDYYLWRKGKYIGIATYTEDENIGNSFQKKTIGASGMIENLVFGADEWMLIVEPVTSRNQYCVYCKCSTFQFVIKPKSAMPDYKSIWVCNKCSSNLGKANIENE